MQKIESALYHRRIFLYTHFKKDTFVINTFKGGLILSSLQMLKSLLIAFMLAFVFKSFYYITWIACFFFAMLFYFLKILYAQNN